MIRQNIQESEWIMRTERSISSTRKEGMIIPCNASILRRRLTILWRNSSILNDESRTTKVNFYKEEQSNRAISNDSWWEIKENRQEQDSCITRDQYFMAPYPFTYQDIFFCVSNSSLTVISERFYYRPDRKFRLSWDYFSLRQKTSISQATAIKISWHPHPTISLLR